MIEKEKWRERERERERERAMDDIYLLVATTVSWVIEESRATDIAKKNLRLQYLSWYHFLRKIKLEIIFMEWVERVMNLND